MSNTDLDKIIDRVSLRSSQGLTKVGLKQALQNHIEQEVLKARIEENQTYLDNINNWKPKPGQLTAASFGAAGASIETAGWKHTFENRLTELKATLNKERG